MAKTKAQINVEKSELLAKASRYIVENGGIQVILMELHQNFKKKTAKAPKKPAKKAENA